MKNTLLFAGVAGLAWAGSAQAAVTVLADRNSEARIQDNGIEAGMIGWNVAGVSNLSLQGFWFRVEGMTREQNIGTLPLTGIAAVDTNPFVDNRPDTLSLQYAGNGFLIEPSWHLRGGLGGSFASDMAETITISNTSTAGNFLRMSFFQYSDFDLGGTVIDQSVEIFGAGGNTARQTDIGFAMSETVVTPAPSRWEVGFYATTLTRLNDANVDDLTNANGPLGPGDLTWCYQWDINLAPGQSVVISKDKSITPAPGGVALLGLGGVLITRRRR